jgi:indole-3-glycerol phosphate synthase
MAGRLEGTYLERIIAHHRARAAADSRSLEELGESAARVSAPARGFSAAISAAEGTAVIAEVKRRSPSRGDLAVDLEPAATARAYEKGGASCLSVLTEREHFGGSRSDLEAARAAVGLPVLRKDFTVSQADIYDARVMGADAVLLIAAALGDEELATFLETARRLGLDALVEVHDGRELDRALSLGAGLIGVNQRDLHTFAVDPDRAVRLRAEMPKGVVSVAESGLTRPEQVGVLAEAGFDAVLVGEGFVTAPDPAAAVEGFVAAGRSAAARCG